MAFENIVLKINKNKATCYNELNGGSEVGTFKIDLKEDKTVFKFQYKRSEKDKLELKRTKDKLLDAKILRISDSEHSSPFFMIRKKDGSFRPVYDFLIIICWI